MASALAGAGDRVVRAPILGIGSSCRCAALAATVACAVGCSNTAPPSGAEIAPAAAAGASAPTGAPVATISTPAPPAVALPTITRARSRWVGATWSELPGWSADRVADFWPAFMRSCERPAPGWLDACASARRLGSGAAPLSDAAVRAWLQQHLRPWRVESLDSVAVGLVTGYFEPFVEASRVSKLGFRVPLYGPPPDLESRKPYWTRQQIETVAAVKKTLHGREIAWLRDRLDALVLHIQGSGRLLFGAEPGRAASVVRAAYAAQNDQPYRSVGRWLVEQGQLRPDAASWPAIRAWARQNPERLDEMLWSNPRYIFFREEPLTDVDIGPKGAQGVALTPGRSIAVDPGSVPFGTPVWLDTTEPLSARPLRRLAVAQDTGAAITGAVRADYFWGWGEDAETSAGRMKQPLRLWVLWPSS